MGNIKSYCCRDSASDIDEREERSRILNNDACSETSNNSHNNFSDPMSHPDSVSYGSTSNYPNGGNNHKSMEQSALDRIYQKMVANVIDVAPGESMVIQTTERQRAYQVKLNQLKTPLPLRTNTSSSSGGGGATGRLDREHNNNHHNSQQQQNNNNQHNSLSIVDDLLNTSAATSSIGGGGANTSGGSGGSPNVGIPGFSDPITIDDIQLINDTSMRSSQALKQLKVTSQEQVITHFKL